MVRAIDGDLLIKALKEELKYMTVGQESTTSHTLTLLAQRDIYLVIITNILEGKYDLECH